MTQYQDFDLSYLNARDESESIEFTGPDAGMRRIQHMNPHMLRRGTSIQDGGFLIQAASTDAYPEFGKREAIKLGDNTTDCYTATSFKAAVLGVTERYWVLAGEVDGKFRQVIVPNYVDPKGPGMPDGWKCYGRCTLFVVPESDPLGRTWSLSVKGEQATNSVGALMTAIKGELNRLRREAKLKPSVPLNTFDIWVDISVDKPVLSGKPGAQSEVSPIMIEPIPAIDLIRHTVGRDNSIKFLDAAREVRVLIDQGKFAPSAMDLMQILPGSAPAAQISAPAATEPQPLGF